MNIRFASIAGTFILNRSSFVLSLDPVVGSFKVGTITSFVTQRPKYDTWMVVVALHIALITLHVCQLVVFTGGQGLLSIAHSMRFNIGFGHHINTILVAQVIPIRVIWIVRSPYTVDVEFLHNLDILNHTFARHHIASIRVQLMTIGSLKEYRLSIHQHLSVLDFYLTETNLYRDYLYHIGVILQCSLQCI